MRSDVSCFMVIRSEVLVSIAVVSAAVDDVASVVLVPVLYDEKVVSEEKTGRTSSP